MEKETPYISEIYTAIINEINRYRDWPIRVLTFTSVLHFGIIGTFIFKAIKLTECQAYLLTFFLIVLGIWTIIYFYKCHINYLEARNTQYRIQCYMNLKKLKIDNSSVLPEGWFVVVKESGFTRFWGWGFYAFYSSALTLCACWAIWRPILQIIQK